MNRTDSKYAKAPVTGRQDVPPLRNDARTALLLRRMTLHDAATPEANDAAQTVPS